MANSPTRSRRPSEPDGPDRITPLVRNLSARMRERQLGLRARLLIGALLFATLPLLVASVILPRRVQAALTHLGETNLIQAATDLAEFTQKTMALHLERVQSIAVQTPLREAVLRHNDGTFSETELAQLNQQLFAVIRDADTEVQGIFVGGRAGFTFAGVLQSGESEPYRHIDIRDRDYFATMARSRQPVISEPLKSKIGGLPVIAVCVPVLDPESNFAGFVAITIKLQHLSNQITHRRIGESGYPFAIDRTGLLVAHPDPKRFFTDTLIRLADAQRLSDRMRAGERGIEGYTSSRGEHKIAAFAPVPICGWSIAASMVIDEFEAPAQQLRLIIYAMIGACVVIAVFVAASFAVGLERLKLALANSQASESRFRLLAGVSAGAIWDWDLETDEFWWNDRLLTSFGWQPEEVATYSAFRERIPEVERDPVSIGLRNCIGDGEWSGEHSFLRRDGTAAYVLHRAVVVRSADGRALRMIGGMTDITERRVSEQKVAEQAALLNETRDGIVVVDLHHVVQFWNSGAEKIFGWTAHEAIGRRTDELLQAEPSVFAEACRQIRTEGQWQGRMKKFTKAGTQLVIETRWTLVRDQDGDPKSIIAIDTDVTERVQMEAKFLRTQRLESLGTLAGGIAHDLNNLLSPIIMGVGMLKLSEQRAEESKIIHYIEQSANRGTHLVKQVLSFARGDEGARVSVHAGYVIREVEAMARSTFPKNITFRAEISRDLRLVRADPTQLNQVLLNLCVNARDAMPAGGHLAITARNIDLDATAVAQIQHLSPGPHVVIEVSDTGTGMPPALIEKIFEPFFTTKAPGKGTGLGLSTALGIVRGHDGALSVYSEVGKGTVFKIYLPETKEGEAPATPEVAATPVPSGQGELILLVDDEPAILNVTKQALEHFGYNVLLATDGAHAFALYHRHRTAIAAVITDMMMPLMDGLALIAALRRVDPAIVAIGASGLNDHNNQIKAADAGIKHFLLKPYTTATLIEIVRTALSERPKRPPQT